MQSIAGGRMEMQGRMIKSALFTAFAPYSKHSFGERGSLFAHRAGKEQKQSFLVGCHKSCLSEVKHTKPLLDQPKIPSFGQNLFTFFLDDCPEKW